MILKQNFLSQIGLCLSSLLLSEEGAGVCVCVGGVPPAPWLGKAMEDLILKMDSLQRTTYTLICVCLCVFQQSKHRAEHDGAIVLVMHNVYASKNRRKIEKSTLTKDFPPSPRVPPRKQRPRKITLGKLLDEVFLCRVVLELRTHFL